MGEGWVREHIPLPPPPIGGRVGERGHFIGKVFIANDRVLL